MNKGSAILVVEDEAILLFAMRQELKLAFGSEHVLETALNAEKGFAAIKRLAEQGTEIAVIISDWLMPGMHGDDFLKKVHADYPLTRLIMLSGHAEASQIRNFIEEIGLDAFLRKPYQRTVLVDAVRDSLSAYGG
jgi:DNA-binding NarL/FixJ family response regulator